jgi:hypothetical protein
MQKGLGEPALNFEIQRSFDVAAVTSKNAFEKQQTSFSRSMEYCRRQRLREPNCLFQRKRKSISRHFKWILKNSPDLIGKTVCTCRERNIRVDWQTNVSLTRSDHELLHASVMLLISCDTDAKKLYSRNYLDWSINVSKSSRVIVCQTMAVFNCIIFQTRQIAYALKGHAVIFALASRVCIQQFTRSWSALLMNV